ncbi:cation diffusion facilitator family transporter [candidate division CSSED10-310 bacterium]|uniref:Cation diffusion facilitator family transporter n=1 Tax=candidate division CSSED10-310 bacterium TaxID=2855610 RepID=A0ABV6Z4J0_UNCC1
MNNDKLKTTVATLSVVSNTTLVILKLAVGLVIGSVSVISEAIHSGVDLIAAVIALIAVRTSGKPADESHPYGHGKIENIAGTLEALLIFVAAGWIIYEAVHKLLHPTPIETVGWGIAIMAFSACANLVVSNILLKTGEKTDSIALKADGMHLRTDVYTSAGVMAGLGIYWIARSLFPSFPLWWIDPVAAIAVALLIIKAAYDLTVESARDLLDARIDPEEEKIVIREIEALYPAVHGFHHLRTRKSGPYRYFDFHLVVSGDLSTRESHDLTDDLKKKIKEVYKDAVVEIHVEPYENSSREHIRKK